MDLIVYDNQVKTTSLVRIYLGKGQKPQMIFIVLLLYSHCLIFPFRISNIYAEVQTVKEVVIQGMREGNKSITKMSSQRYAIPFYRFPSV